MKNPRPLSSEWILFFTLAAVVTAYVFFFVVLPQDWTLRDDYFWVRSWGQPGFDHWAGGRKYLESIMATGRFQPVDTLSRILHFRYVPVTPRAFHVTFFALATVALTFFWRFLRAAGVSRAAALLGVVLAVSNLSFKEWLTTLTVSESWATTFLCIALAFYASGRRWLAVPFYALSFFSKEGFVVGLGAFAAYELGGRLSKPRPIKSIKAEELGPLAAMIVLGVSFAAFVHSLPRAYTSGLTATKISLLPLLKSFIGPAIKSFGPALGLLALALARQALTRRKITPQQWALAGAGAALIVAFTLLLNAWGPFDSWFYLHLAIPFGWAMVFAAFWSPLDAEAETSKSSRPSLLARLAWSRPLEYGVLGATFIFFLLSAMNGGRNYTSYFAMAKKAAELACEDASRVGGLKVYSNCNEGSVQLVEYLRLSGRCARPPKIEYLNAAPALPTNVQPPYSLLISTKCDPFDQGSVPASFRTELDQWVILKKL